MSTPGVAAFSSCGRDLASQTHLSRGIDGLAVLGAAVAPADVPHRNARGERRDRDARSSMTWRHARGHAGGRWARHRWTLRSDGTGRAFRVPPPAFIAATMRRSSTNAPVNAQAHRNERWR